MRDDFTGCKTLSKVEPMYLEVTLKEAKCDWCIYRLESKKQSATDLFSR